MCVGGIEHIMGHTDHDKEGGRGHSLARASMPKLNTTLVIGMQRYILFVVSAAVACRSCSLWCRCGHMVVVEQHRYACSSLAWPAELPRRAQADVARGEKRLANGEPSLGAAGAAGPRRPPDIRLLYTAPHRKAPLQM